MRLPSSSGGLVVAVIVWLLFTHWQWGVSVLLILILANQGRAR
ncbi:hypothetical protein [Mycolicibacterium canariasense]|nr:hypothetical protein [Mycolicibacterium canariasense]